GPHVLLGHHDVLDEDLAFIGQDAEHTSFLPLIASGDDLHRIVTPDIHSLVFWCRCRWHIQNSYRTSGARETIFKNLFSRSSRATGPNTRVPTGSPASLISTAAFCSKRI